MNRKETPPAVAASPAPQATPANAGTPAAEAAADLAEQRQRILLHMPVDVRSVSLGVLAVIASVVALQWAKAVFVPVLLGVMFSYALTPAIDRVVRWNIHRGAAAGLVLTVILSTFGWGAWALGDDANELIESLPQIAQRLRQTIQGQPTKSGDTIAKMQQAASEIEKVAEDAARQAAAAAAAAASAAAASAAASTASGVAVRTSAAAATSVSVTRKVPAGAPATAASAPETPTRVVIEKPRIDVREYLWSGTLGLIAFLGQFAIVFFITFFLLASGDLFRRKMVKLAGPRLSQKKITVQALDEISAQIQRYLLVQLATSVLTGILTGLAFWAIGLNHAAVWGVLAGVTNLIPYLGAVLIGAASSVVGFMQFGSFDMALLVGGASFGIHAVIGNLLTPWLTGRAGRMSPFVVFVAVLAFGWLWGPVGLILGVPIVMVVKSICDRIEDLKPIGEFLGT